MSHPIARVSLMTAIPSETQSPATHVPQKRWTADIGKVHFVEFPVVSQAHTESRYQYSLSLANRVRDTQSLPAKVGFGTSGKSTVS